MVKTRRVKLIVLLMAIVMAVSVFFGLFVFREKSTSTVRAAEETVSVTQVQFRTTGGPTYYFFLRMDGQTDYTTGSQLHNDCSFITNTNLLDKVTVYFVDGAASLRDVWTGEYVYTYLWGDGDTLAFPMKAGYIANKGVGARIEAGTQIPMLNGTNKVTSVSRSFWPNGTSNDNVINNYTEGYDTITTSIAKVHLRGAFLIGLGAGNDWNEKGEAYPTEVIGSDGTNSYSRNNWYKMYLSNFTSKIKLHVKETDTWMTLGKILNPPEGAPQCVMVFNGWESGGVIRLAIDTAYNGTTIDQIFFEKGCELPSYNFVGNAMAHTVHVLDKNYLCTSNDMSTADFAVNWTFTTPHRVTFNNGNAILVNDGATVDFPADLSESKPDDASYSYTYNWFLNGEIYDFSTPVTGDINLTSDGSFTKTPKQYTVTYLHEDGSVYKTERVPFGSTLTYAVVPDKLGATEGRWTYNGGDLPTTMPAYDITLQASYEADFHVNLMHFRSEGEGNPQWLLMMPNATDYTETNTFCTASFLDGTNILDNVTVYFKHGAYSLRDVWDGTGLATKIWGAENAIAFRMKSGFLSVDGVGIQVNIGTEFPMHDGSKLKTMETRTFWSNNDSSNDVVDKYTDGYREIPVDVTKVNIRSDENLTYKYLLIGLGDGNDWNGKGTALPTQAIGADETTTHAMSYWQKIYLANFMNHIKLHVAASDTWVELGDIVDTDSAGGSMQVLTYNAWGEQGGVVIIPIQNAYNGTTIDKVLFEEGCQLPSYDFNARDMEYTVHTLNREQLFISNDMTQAHWAINWSTKHQVTFNGANGVLVNNDECVEYPAHLSETKEEDENYYYIYNWYLNGELYDFSTPVTKSINLTSDGTFSAIKKPQYYTVTFDANNGAKEVVETVGENTTVSAPTDPTKTRNGYQYEFIGWYNGDELYEFSTPVTKDLTLTAKYRETKLLVLSDLYNETQGDPIFKTGEIQIANEAATFAAPKGYYADYAATPNFELSFDLKYTAASTYSTFTIYMTSNDEINNTSPFYVGWKLWFYRPNDLPIHFQYLQYNGSAADTRVVFAEAGCELRLVKDTIYTVKISYKVIDASNGTVEMSITIGDWSNTTTYTLGADYFNANAANSNKLFFTAESTNGSAASLVAGDPGLIGKARQDVTLMNGEEAYVTDTTNQIVLPSLPSVKNDEEGLAQVFVGWTTDPDFGEGFKLYSAGYKLQLANETTLYAVWIGFEMQEGAAVRLAADSSGIRFLTDIDRAGYQLGIEKGLILSVGTIIAPTSYLTKVSLEHNSFPNSNYYTERETETWRVEGNENETWTYAAAFVNISEAQYSRAMSARGYIQINFTDGVGYIYTPYTEEKNARSIYEVATNAYNDTEKDYQNNTVILKYINSVADIVLDADNGLSKTGVGSYGITSSINDEHIFTINVTGDMPIKTALINGTRMTEGYNRNIVIGDFVYSVDGYTLDEANGTITFALKAAEELEDKYSDGLVYFQSSDADLDFFLNDYFKRHAGNVFENGVDQKVTSVSAGFTSQEFFWQEWFSLAYYPISSMQDGSDARIEGLREKLSGVPVDEYGYVWQNTDAVRDVYSDLTSGEHRMGWPFPTSAETHYTITEKHLWYNHNYDTTYSASWDFNGADRLNGWTSNISASVANGLLSGYVSNQTSSITFTSPTLNKSYTEGNTNGTSDWSNWTHKTTSMVAYYAPLLELDVRMDNASGVEDIIVNYTSTKGTGSVSVNEKAFISYPYEGKYEHMLVLPMYASANWGDSEYTYITSITIEIKMKSGSSMNGNVGLSYVRGAFDTRHTNNMALLISALRQDYDYTGDLQYLQENITRARKAVNFLMQAYDESRSLIASDYLVGHDSDKSGNKQQSQAGSLGNGYWDISFMPKYDFHTNTNFYMALTDLAYLEGVLEGKGITVEKAAATVKTANRNCVYGTSAYNYDSDALTEIAGKVQKALQATTNDSDHTGFWSEKTGRFVAGYSEKEGKWYDYGYLVWNIEAVYYGVATEAQEKSIMDWVSGKRIVDGDTSTGEDIYFFDLAPRVNTYQGANANDVSIYTGIYSDQKTMVYGVTQCQNGGAIMYSSFYDLMNRINVYGADNAFERLQAIQAWYKEIYDYYEASDNYNVAPDRFYWDYYENSQWDSNGDGKGEYWALQNGIKGIEEREKVSGGIIGVDGEFLESILPMASIYYGFFGIESVNAETLKIAPKLPGDLQYWKTENLMFCDVKYDLTIRKNALQISSISSDESAKNLSLTVVFEAPNSEYGVYINGFKTNNYRVENGNIYVDIALNNVIIEIR